MKTIDQINFQGKKALIRVDFNVPLNEDLKITDDTRICAALPTINKILSEDGSVILMSHLGRPKNGHEDKFSLKHIVNNLSENGKFWIIVPYVLFKLIDDNEIFSPLKINYLKIIHSKIDKLNSRVVIQFSFRQTKKIIHEMVLRNKDNTYTRDYINLTHQFHDKKLG